MNNLAIPEGGSVELSPGYIELAKDIKSKNPSLPFNVDGSSIKFDDYIVGELLLKDISIKLSPRNAAFNLNTYFEILCYLHDIDNFMDIGSGFSEGDQFFNIDQVSKSFCEICSKLMQYGLTGSYFNFSENTFEIDGQINFDELLPKKIFIDGVPQTKSEYSLDTPQNRLIKAALQKLSQIEDTSKNPKKFQLLRELSRVEDCSFTKDEALKIFDGFYSPNPWYIAAIDFSIKVLFELEIEYLNGSIEWMSFLQNSNTIFEEYVRKILKDNLNEEITKWESPKPFLSLRSLDNKFGNKSFSPDIIVNYDQKLNKADLVLDVKNKSFEPDKLSSLDSLTNTSDIYQLFFYCNQLQAKFGGLIYPSSTSNSPIELMIDSSGIERLYAFSINMRESLTQRHKKLGQEIHNYLLREI